MIQNIIVLKEMKDVFYTLVNKHLDTYYDNKPNDKMILTYEELRRKIIDETELTDLEYGLLILLVNRQIALLENSIQQYEKAINEFYTIKNRLVEDIFN